MEEVDKILIHSLKQAGTAVDEEVSSLRQFSSELIVEAVVRCLRVIDPGLGGALPTALPPGMSARFRVGMGLAQACQDVGYKGEIGYQTFLYSSEPEIRSLLMFLVEKLPRESAEASDQPSGKSAVLQRSIAAAIKAQLSVCWVPPSCRLPLHCETQRLGAPHSFFVQPLSSPSGSRDSDQQLPEVVEYRRDLLPPLSSQLCSSSSLAASLLELHTAELSAAQEGHAEWKSQGLPARLAPQDYRARKMARLQKRIEDQLRSAASPPAGGAAPPPTARAAAGPQRPRPPPAPPGPKEPTSATPRSSASHRKRRRWRAACCRCGRRRATGSRRSWRPWSWSCCRSAAEWSSSTTTPGSPGSPTPRSSIRDQSGTNRVTHTQVLHQGPIRDQCPPSGTNQGPIGSPTPRSSIRDQSGINRVTHTQVLDELQQRQLGNASSEERLQVKKQTLDLLPEADANVPRLQALVEAGAQRVLSLAAQWEKRRAPLIDEHRRLREICSSQDMESSRKLSEIKSLHDKIRVSTEEAKKKEETYKQLVAELESLPQDASRSAYTQRILEIVSNIRKQKEEITKILSDTKELQKEINGLTGKLDRTFAVTDELVFKDAKKDESVRKSYKYLAALHENCSQLIQTIEDTGTILREIRDLEEQIETETGNKPVSNLERILDDYRAVRQENSALAAKVREA
ncbi:coiled-coil domain-containing protein 22 [Menidia menidia]